MFGNPEEFVFSSIIKAHKKWASHGVFEKIFVVFYSNESEKSIESFKALLTNDNVPFLHKTPIAEKETV